jgi:hypothetical protein
MTAYVQYSGANLIHVVRNQWENGTYHTHCGRFYVASMALTPDLRGEREEDVVCAECRRLAAAQAGKRVYSQPTLRHGLSEAKQRKLAPLFKAHTERQRLAAWNRAAQEAKTL